MTRQLPDSDAEKHWYRRGAEDEARVLETRLAKMSEDGRQVFSYVRVLAQQGRSGDAITESTARVFTATWTFKQRLRLAWRLVRNR